jgi:hypothetical protein
MPSCAGVTEEGCGRKALNSEPTEQQITAGKTAIAPLFFPVSARSKVRISAENRDPVHDKISGKNSAHCKPSCSFGDVGRDAKASRSSIRNYDAKKTRLRPPHG